jgi:hypothetical protein
MEEDRLNFDRTIWVVQNQSKINRGDILEKYKITPKCKAWSACSIVHDGSHANC